MINKSLFLAPLSLALLTSSVAFAEPHNSGNYIEGNVGTLYATVSFWGDTYTQFGSVGANVNLGHQFMPYFATEVGYTNYGASSLNMVDLAAKLILPFNVNGNDFSVFAKAGPAYGFSPDDSGFIPFAGIGAGYSVNQNLDVTLQAQGVSEGFFSLGLLSAGLTYHFG